MLYQIVTGKMKEIKFRARWRDTGKIIPDFMEEYTVDALNDNSFIVEQFTGLHDKNGKEIYEGDIVKGHSTGQYEGLIHFAYGEYRIRCKNSDRSLCDEWKFIEVIGNIHENKEAQ